MTHIRSSRRGPTVSPAPPRFGVRPLSSLRMSDPAAYFITISVYGGRLHGDERGTSRRTWQADPSQPPVAANALRVATERAAMKNDSPVFRERHRATVGAAIQGVCTNRGWTLHAINVRTNHVHLVVSCQASVEIAMNTFKAWSTRRLREAGLAGADERIWARHGSTRYLWTDKDVEEAVLYVIEGQGRDLLGE